MKRTPLSLPPDSAEADAGEPENVQAPDIDDKPAYFGLPL